LKNLTPLSTFNPLQTETSINFRFLWDVAPYSHVEVEEVRTASIIIALMVETVRTSELLVNFNVTTRRYIPQDSKLHNRRLENPKCHTETIIDYFPDMYNTCHIIVSKMVLINCCPY
jgi:hypothetical protein